MVYHHESGNLLTGISLKRESFSKFLFILDNPVELVPNPKYLFENSFEKLSLILNSNTDLIELMKSKILNLLKTSVKNRIEHISEHISEIMRESIFKTYFPS